MRIFKLLFILSISILFIHSCGKNYIPRPYGYFRVDLATPNYSTIDTLGLPYQFLISDQAKLKYRNEPKEQWWIDIDYPNLNASVYCSYKSIKGNLYELSEDSRKYVYKHSVKADGIMEREFQNYDKNVYGILYDLKGNTASSVQFVLTDSINHFFRAALYFNNTPNKDSIAPIANYIRKDMIRIMESFEWKN